MIFLKKAWEKIKKYWQIFVGLLVGLGFAIKFWWQLRAQKKVLKNTIESEKKIHDINEKHDKTVENIEKIAKEGHDARVIKINLDNEKAKKEAQEDLDNRVTDNQSVSNETLADRIASTFEVNVVKPQVNDETGTEEDSNEK